MRTIKSLKEGHYFLHSYNTMGNNNNLEIHSRQQMILLKDSFEHPYTAIGYSLIIPESYNESNFNQGDFLYFDGKQLFNGNNNYDALVYAELNRQLIQSLGINNIENKPVDNIGGSRVRSYHVNVGHGNCSIIVFFQNSKWNIWMVDCSVYDFTNRKNYSKNLNDCLDAILKEYGVDCISKLLITHHHYDHINGIEHLMKKGWIDGNTEVWLNLQYPWSLPTYNRILLELSSLGVNFIDPIEKNSINGVRILHPSSSYNSINKAPKSNVNNASVLYQLCFDEGKMLFTGDMEEDGWNNVSTCKPYMFNTDYYCISHHGSITGHSKKYCASCLKPITTAADCVKHTKYQILMGRDKAYNGIYSKKVLSDYNHLVKTEDAGKYLYIEWSTGKCNFVK